MENPISVSLDEYSSNCHQGGIGHDMEWFCGIQHANCWSGEEHLLELDECVILLLLPVKGDPFLSLVMKGSSKSGEVGMNFQ